MYKVGDVIRFYHGDEAEIIAIESGRYRIRNTSSGRESRGWKLNTGVTLVSTATGASPAQILAGMNLGNLGGSPQLIYTPTWVSSAIQAGVRIPELGRNIEVFTSREYMHTRSYGGNAHTYRVDLLDPQDGQVVAQDRLYYIHPGATPWRYLSDEGVPETADTQCRQHTWVHGGGKLSWCSRCEIAGYYNPMTNEVEYT